MQPGISFGEIWPLSDFPFHLPQLLPFAALLRIVKGSFPLDLFLSVSISIVRVAFARKKENSVLGKIFHFKKVAEKSCRSTKTCNAPGMKGFTPRSPSFSVFSASQPNYATGENLVKSASSFDSGGVNV